MSITRREFVRLSAAAGATACLTGSLTSALVRPADMPVWALKARG